MKKYIIFFLLLFCPFIVNAYTGPLDESNFYIDSQSSTPYHITIDANSTKLANFHLYWADSLADDGAFDWPGSYLFISIVSTQKLDIKRAENFGSSCSSSCFSNDRYLMQTGYENGVYNYVFYFNIVKYHMVTGSRIIEWFVDDYFRFYNKGNSSANVYIYGAYADDNNSVPNLINNVNTTSDMIDNNNQNTQEIINNQNDNMQSDCQNLINVNATTQTKNGTTMTINSDKSITISGTPSTTTFFTISSSLNLPAGTYIMSGGYQTSKIRIQANFGSKFVSSEKEYQVFTLGSSTTTSGVEIRVSTSFTGSITLYPMINKGTKKATFCAYGTKVNKIDETTDSINNVKDSVDEVKDAVNGTTDAINGVNNSINNSNIDNPNNDLTNISNMVAENGVITNLLILPITLYTAVLNSVNGTCNTFNLGSLYGTNLSFSCVNISNFLGSNIYNTIDILISGFFVYHISRKMIKVFNNFSSLKEGDVLDD